MAVSFVVEAIKFNLKEKTKIKSWIKRIVEKNNFKLGSVTYIFCSDTYQLEMNKKYLNHDTYTDIITFDYTEKLLISGDIFVSIDRVKENSEKYGVSFDDELRRVLIHGIWHLMGEKDKTKKQIIEMRQKEKESLDLFEEMFIG